MAPGSPEYQRFAAAAGEGVLLTDIWQHFNPGRKVPTWHPNTGRDDAESAEQLDYCFLTASLTPSARVSWIDEAAAGSDHQPLWVEFDSAD